MKKKKQLKWRLDKLPSVDELTTLVDKKIITQEEAKEVLFTEQTETRDEKSLKEEIKFLKNLVEKLSENKTEVVKIIETISQPYTRKDFWRPYEIWCESNRENISIGSTTNSTGGSLAFYDIGNFGDITTF